MHPAVVVADSAPGESDVSARKIRVACVGDSITWGYAMTNRVEECYPAQLQKILGDRYEVVNFGNSGSCVYSDPKTGPSGWRPHPWRPGGAAAYAFKPDIVVSGLGANDASIHMYEYIYDENGVPKTEPGLFRREYIDLLKGFEEEGSGGFPSLSIRPSATTASDPAASARNSPQTAGRSGRATCRG